MSSQEKEQFNPLPASGDIVFCRFPQSVGVPGPKSRPALVVGVSKDDHAVQVIYGTSQRTDRLYPTEILLSKIIIIFGTLSWFSIPYQFIIGNEPEWLFYQ